LSTIDINWERWGSQLPFLGYPKINPIITTGIKILKDIVSGYINFKIACSYSNNL